MIVDGELEGVEGKTPAEIESKRSAILYKYLGTKPSVTKGQFADPAAFFTAQ